MPDHIRAKIRGKTVSVYPAGDASAPAVYANMYGDGAAALLEHCRSLGCGPFHLVAVTDLRWDEDLSPWPQGPLVTKNDSFTGGAEEYIRLMESEIVPFAEETLRSPAFRVIAGYSMAGLFAVYAPYVTDLFSASVSASGSLWYPDLLPFVRTHEFKRRPAAVYLSLGDRESRARNPHLRQVESRTGELCALYRDMGIETVFQLNPGSHYTDPDLRLAKGIAWVLGKCESIFGASNHEH